MNFKLLNIPVQIHPTFWLLLLYFSDIWQKPSIETIIFGVIFVFSLVVHELGHALTAKYFGMQPTITLWALGGKAQYDGRGITPFQDFIVTLNGPLSNCLLIAISYALLKIDYFYNFYYLAYFLSSTMEMNIIWCLLNLIPIYPFDGGHLARYLLEKKFGDNGYRISITLGLICMAYLAPYLFSKGFFFFGTLVIVYGLQNFYELWFIRGKASSFVQGIGVRNLTESDKTKIAFKKQLKSKNTQIKNSAIESLAKIYYLENEPQKSYDLLLKSDHQSLGEGKCLLCKLAFDQENYALVTKYSREIYAIEPSFEIAVLNSKAFACLAQPELSGAWLVTAFQFGDIYRDYIKEIVSHQLYDQVRDHATFKQSIHHICS